MRIYRVEHSRTHCGPYISSNWPASWTYEQRESMFEMEYDHSDDIDNHPTPWNDGIGYFGENMHCGFASLKSLDTWFEGFHDMLSSLNFVIAIYEVGKEFVEAGDRQVIFDLDSAKRIETISLTPRRNSATIKPTAKNVESWETPMLNLTEVRTWAEGQGITTGKRGRLGRPVIAAFLAAHPKTARQVAALVGVEVGKRGRLSPATVASIAALVK